MANRNYQCAICHKLFRKETGMQSHLVRQHETPAAMEVMRQDYEAKEKTTAERLADVTSQLDDAKARINVLNFELLGGKKDNLLLLADYIKSEAETKRVNYNYETLLLALGLGFPSKTGGNVPNLTGASVGAAVSVGTLKANESDPLAPPAVSSAPTAVLPDVPLKTGGITPPVYDPEELERIRATFGYGKYASTKLPNQSAGPVTASK